MSTTKLNVFQLKITLRDTEPPVWRRILVEPFTTLGDLHYIIQAIMPWEDYHLHQFVVGKKIYGDPETDDFGSKTLEEYNIDLETLYNKRLRKFVYEYDFGDGWGHHIQIEKSSPLLVPILLPRCIGGERACPPEDSGGPWGFAEKIKILRDRKHKYYKDTKDWMGKFDPSAFSMDSANERLQVTIFEEPDEEFIEHFQNACGWCDIPMREDEEVFGQGVRFNNNFDLKAFEGKVVPFILSSRKTPVLCFVPSQNSTASQNGEEGYFKLCSENCCAELQKALQDEAVPFVEDSIRQPPLPYKPLNSEN